MIFTSFEYVAFFILVVLGRSLCRSVSAEKSLFLIASYLFYMSWNPLYIFLILFTSSIDYLLGRYLGNAQTTFQRRGLLCISLITNLGVLAYFKYGNFLIDNWNYFAARQMESLRVPFYDVILPVGISFFTFQSLSYTIDVYRGELKPCRKPRDFFLYVAFFPQLVAGPIVRAKEFLPQLAQRVRGTVADWEAGILLFLMGAVKKLVISDQISGHVDIIFRNPGEYNGASLLLGLVGYALQIYCDFSGYTDMAIGSARVLGYHFPENFRMPYSARNVTDFWRRWHITLSTWLKDYLYIPLGGNRKGIPRTYLNLIITMFLGGLWHGASWTFIVWGLIHGFALVGHKIFTDFAAGKNFPPMMGSLFRALRLDRLLTLCIVLLGWLFFRAESWNKAMEMLRGIFTNQEGVSLMSPQIFAATASVILIHIWIKRDDRIEENYFTYPSYKKVALFTALLTALTLFGARRAAPFVYFQF